MKGEVDRRPSWTYEVEDRSSKRVLGKLPSG